MSKLIQQTEAAERLGLTPQAVGKWAVRPGAPTRTQGGKRLLVWPDFARWREGELERQAREETMSRLVGSDIKKSQERKLAAEAELAELKVEVERGKLVEIEQYERRLGGVVDLLRAKVQAIAGKYSPRTIGLTNPSESQAVWEDCARDLLTALSETELPEPEEGEE